MPVTLVVKDNSEPNVSKKFVENWAHIFFVVAVQKVVIGCVQKGVAEGPALLTCAVVSHGSWPAASVALEALGFLRWGEDHSPDGWDRVDL